MGTRGLSPSDDDRPPDSGEDLAITESFAATRGHRGTPAMRPPEAINPYVAPPVSRRRRSEWPVLLVALVLSGLIMAGFCLAGFALYVRNGNPFH
jgi:hypothetical protein